MSEKAGTLVIDASLDLSSLKRTLKNILAAVEASEAGLDLLVKSEAKPTFGTVIDGKVFNVNDVETILSAIKRGEIIL